MIRPERINKLNSSPLKKGPVVYWMSRDIRVGDNWALIFAQHLAVETKSHLAVLFCLVPKFLGATLRQYAFMLKGLKEVETNLRKKNIPFFLLEGDPQAEIPRFVKRFKVGALAADFNPLKISVRWKNQVGRHLTIPFYEVDAHNIVPARFVSRKQEFAAYTIRPKIHRLLSDFLDDYPKIDIQAPYDDFKGKEVDFKGILKRLKIDRTVEEIEWIEPGEKAARRMLEHFIDKKMGGYSENRNDPTRDAQSDLSPYVHFGHISAQTIAKEIIKNSLNSKEREAFLEELIVRRELADNFCLYNRGYDSFKGFPEWAKKTLTEHRSDKREYVYSLDRFENADTHDDLWNAAQTEMMTKGKMHGYMRMYWAKKILQWSKSPEEALKTAIYLNDKYELDGRDPNGYAGIAWSIGGVHDRAWGAREIFGKIRYMSYKGCKAKFEVREYINKYLKR